ncbi:MAG TPA: SRPBCC domain-containing protein [Caulobacteraceae bacterium]|jgi:uncharacterized protein YndB with AHSA1/START domain
MTPTTADARDREILLVRVFDAPRELVFRAWTDPKMLGQWWGPRGFSNPVCEADARVGGKWRIVMRGPDGNDYPHGGEYLEVVPPEKLVMTNALEGDIHPFGESVWTVTFDEVDGKTTVLTRVLCKTRKDRDAMAETGFNQGYGMSLDRLDDILHGRAPDSSPAAAKRDPGTSMALIAKPGEAQMQMTRWFDAPRELVWEAVTRPEHFANWWGPRKYRAVNLQMDVREGGKWSVEQHGGEGEVHPFHGEYLEIAAPRRLVLTQAYRDYPPMVVEMTFTPDGAGTRIDSVLRARSVEERDGMLNSGMEWGMRESYARLDELLVKLAG